MSVLFLFIDGVGLGEKGEQNPFSKREYESFHYMSGGQPFNIRIDEIDEGKHIFKKVDANLGVEGLPQSGTGQTALFSGVNAPAVIGKHFGPFPHSGIKHLLREQSLFHKVQQKGISAHFINAYPEIFFQKASKRNRWSCTTLMTKSADISLNDTESVKRGEAVTAGITQRAWREMLNIEVPLIEPEEAAGRLIRKTESHRLVLHEYYLTDKAGHGQDAEKAQSVLEVYDRFLMELIRSKREEDTIVLSSDHGNLEDLSVKTHTRNAVPLFAYGPGAEELSGAESIMDVTPGILKILGKT